MTRVRKVAAVSLMTPMVAAAITIGVNQQAAQAAACPPLASASISPPTGTVRAGSSVHVSATISGWMVLKAHLQISGPGLDKQVGSSVNTGTIQGDTVVPEAGYFTLAVIGNGTKCTYKAAGFSVKEKASAAKPTHSSSPSKSARAGGGGSGSSGGSGANVPSLPTGSAGNGAGGNLGLNPLNGASPFSLPSVAPDGSSFQYPSPDPQVASPPTRTVARNVSETTPIKWGQSLAIALVLLVISAHLGMWSRRQRLAADGAHPIGARKLIGRRKSRGAAATLAETSVLDRPAETALPPDAAQSTESELAPPATTPDDASAADHVPDAEATADDAAGDSTPATDDASAAEEQQQGDGGRNYRGRRRRR